MDGIELVGEGGTIFGCIFEVKPDFFKDEHPSLVIIMMDGYEPFPAETATKDIPMLWIIVDSDIEPAWGEVIYIDTITSKIFKKVCFIFPRYLSSRLYSRLLG